MVLLHGISSGSASWIKQLNDSGLTDGHRLLAWDAPGYGGSLPLADPQADAAGYAAALAALIDELQLAQPLIVGHSLGALIGSAYAAGYPDGLCGLVLADPAQGYATAPEEKRRQVYGQRQQMIETLGRWATASSGRRPCCVKGRIRRISPGCATACSSSIPTVF